MNKINWNRLRKKAETRHMNIDDDTMLNDIFDELPIRKDNKRRRVWTMVILVALTIASFIYLSPSSQDNDIEQTTETVTDSFTFSQAINENQQKSKDQRQTHTSKSQYNNKKGAKTSYHRFTTIVNSRNQANRTVPTRLTFKHDARPRKTKNINTFSEGLGITHGNSLLSQSIIKENKQEQKLNANSNQSRQHLTKDYPVNDKLEDKIRDKNPPIFISNIDRLSMPKPAHSATNVKYERSTDIKAITQPISWRLGINQSMYLPKMELEKNKKQLSWDTDVLVELAKNGWYGSLGVTYGEERSVLDHRQSVKKEFIYPAGKQFPIKVLETFIYRRHNNSIKRFGIPVGIGYKTDDQISWWGELTTVIPLTQRTNYEFVRNGQFAHDPSIEEVKIQSNKTMKWRLSSGIEYHASDVWQIRVGFSYQYVKDDLLIVSEPYSATWNESTLRGQLGIRYSLNN